MSEYHINLLEQRGKMHWREFKALFDGLSENSYMQRIISIRQRDLSDVEDGKVRQQLTDAKSYYALDEPQNETVGQDQGAQVSALSAMFNAMRGQTKKGGQ